MKKIKTKSMPKSKQSKEISESVISSRYFILQKNKGSEKCFMNSSRVLNPLKSFQFWVMSDVSI
jgi:hypothetical protein